MNKPEELAPSEDYRRVFRGKRRICFVIVLCFTAFAVYLLTIMSSVFEILKTKPEFKKITYDSNSPNNIKIGFMFRNVTPRCTIQFKKVVGYLSKSDRILFRASPFTMQAMTDSTCEIDFAFDKFDLTDVTPYKFDFGVDLLVRFDVFRIPILIKHTIE